MDEDRLLDPLFKKAGLFCFSSALVLNFSFRLQSSGEVCYKCGILWGKVGESGFMRRESNSRRCQLNGL